MLKSFKQHDSICVLGGSSLLQCEAGSECGKAGGRRTRAGMVIAIHDLTGLKEGFQPGRKLKLRTCDWNQKPSCRSSCRPGLQSATQHPLSGLVAPAQRCADGRRVGGQWVGLVELQPLLAWELLQAYAWTASQCSFLDLPINYFMAPF